VGDNGFVPHAHVDDIEIYFERGGKPGGPKVLLISGTGGDLREQPSVLASPLRERYDLLAYDQRGLGQSSKPDVAYTMADYARDAVGLLDSVSWDHCSVLGISFGGMVAQEVALLAPQRVERLVLCCTSSGGSGGASYPLHELEGLPPDERVRTSLSLSDERWDDAWQAARPDIVGLYRSRGSLAAGDPAAAAGARRQLDARAAHDTAGRLSQLTMPILICAGRYDGIAPLANAEAIADRVANPTLEVFDGGHLFLLQDTRAWQLIESFLAQG